MRQLQPIYSTKLFGSTKVAGFMLGIGGMVFLGGVCTKIGTDVAVNSNAGANSSISNRNENTNSSEIDTSDWLTYTNEEYGFSFRYPMDWNLAETTSGISLTSPELVNNTYRNSMTLSVTQNDFDSQKKEIENSDLIDEGISLSKFNDGIEEVKLKTLTALVGTHSTAIGLTEQYYYISLPNNNALYIEFLEPDEKINLLVDDVIQTLDVI